MAIDGLQETDVQEPKHSSWYVALAQLPGMPVKVRLEVLALVTGTLQQMPVVECRNHFWAGGARNAASASEDSDGLEDAAEDADLTVPESRDPSSETREQAVAFPR